MNESYLTHRQFRYLKLSAWMVLLALAGYVWHEPLDGPNGGTLLGYTLGGLGAFIILLLMWFGVRKRRFRSRWGTVRGWLSAHVYLGLGLIVIATLHTGFQFGWNIHTYAYVLMILVIFSGIYGAIIYAIFPTMITNNRKGSSPDLLLQEIARMNQRCLALADKLGKEMHQMVVQLIEETRIGGGVFRQLIGHRKHATVLEQKAEQFLKQRTQKLNIDLSGGGDSLMKLMDTAKYMAGEEKKENPESRASLLRSLMELIGQRRMLVRRLNRDIKIRARMQIWLYLHVPLSFALLAALTAHIVSVFIYW